VKGQERGRRRFRLDLAPRHVDAQVEDELRFHRQELVDRLMSAGLDEASARAEADRMMGDQERAADSCHRIGRARLAREALERAGEGFVRELRQGVRALRLSPGFTASVLICLALGIGATTAVYSVLYGVVLKPLSFPESERLVMVWETFRTRNIDQGMVSYPNLAEWRRRNRVFEGIGSFHPTRHTLSGMELPVRIVGARADAEFFRALGVEPALGRLFDSGDDAPGAEDVVVVSDGFWQQQLGGDPEAIGRSLELDQRSYTVIGVLPPGFDFPVAVAGAEVWTATAEEVTAKEQRGWPALIAVGRLRPGISMAEAQAQMEVLGRQLETDFPETNTAHGFNLVDLGRQTASRVRGLLLLLMGAVVLVLLIACSNVASLLLARADRRTDLAIRTALGAGRGMLARQVLVESLILGLGGALLGIALALAGTRLLPGLIPTGFPRMTEVAVDGPVLLFTLVTAVATSLLFGSLPALQAARTNVATALAGVERTTPGRGPRLIRRSLIVVETALALTLLAGAGLLIRSFERMLAVDPGHNPRGVLTFSMARAWSDYDVIQRGEFYIDLARRLNDLPGVVAAAGGNGLPMSEGGHRTIVRTETQRETPRADLTGFSYLSVTPDYFTTLGIPLLQGRAFTADENRSHPGAMIVNRSAARLLWPDEEPLGKRTWPDVDITLIDPTEFTVVGVVGDVRDSGLDQAASPTVYVPCTQQTWPTATFAVRVTGDPLAAAPMVRHLVGELTDEPVFSFRALDEGMGRSVGQRRYPMVLLMLFAALAVALAAFGIHGVLAYSVVQKRQEIGIRMALGAGPERISRLFLIEGMGLAALGILMGLAGALASTSLLRGLLFEVTPHDPLTLVTAALLMLAVAAAATWQPTRRAARTDPVRTLARR
jgi:putative ABC transport system permease protein